MNAARLSVSILALTGALACDGGWSSDDREPTDPPEPDCFDCEPQRPTGRLLPELTVADSPPPAVSGGTLAISLDGALAVAADPDRDRVYVVDLNDRTVRHRVAAEGEPGRVVLQGDKAWVALRSGGAVLSVDLESGASERHAACPSPRGLAFEGDRLHVACAGGELVSLDGRGAVVRRVQLEPDLRDVVVAGERLLVSRFRSAELLEIDFHGRVTGRLRPQSGTQDPFSGGTFEPSVAWRTVAGADGTVWMLHQRSQLSSVVVSQPDGYGGLTGDPCNGGIVHAAVTEFPPEGEPVTVGRVGGSVVAVDLTVHEGGGRFAVASAGGQFPDGLDRTSIATGADPCLVDFDEEPMDPEVAAVDAMITAVARLPDGDVVAQSREPAVLLDARRRVLVELDDESRFDAGHDLFHRDTGGGIACASCHPEGRDDGHTWLFEGSGLRRTQSLVGGIRATAPFHWVGDMHDFAMLAREVMGVRMGGPVLPDAYSEALLDWIDAQPALPALTRDAAAIERGALVFHDPDVGCASCHGGDALTDNTSHDVGTGGVFQTPALVGVGVRAPLMHDGCAPGMVDRFDPMCGGGDQHGRTSHLSAAQLGDLAAWLETR